MERERVGQRAQVSSDFDLARGLAEAIGLADRPPLAAPPIPFIANTLPKRQRVRKVKGSDFHKLERELNSQRVRQRQQSLRQQERTQRERSIRKNAVKDVFVNLQKPQDNPFILAKTQRIILRNEAARTHKYEQQKQQLRKISSDKSRRSRILGEIFDKEEEIWLGEQSQVKRGRTTVNSFYQPKFFLSGKKMKPRESVQKLAVSFDFSRFNLVSRQGELHLQARSDQRRIQTANTGRRTVRLQFKEDKCQMLYPNFSQSGFLNDI